jgi:hypothetical protein
VSPEPWCAARLIRQPSRVRAGRLPDASALCFVSAKVLATVGGGVLTLWDPTTGKRLASAKMPNSNRRSLPVSSLGPLLVTTGPVALFTMS